MDFNQSETKKNLAKAFAAECQAGARYQFMATQAQTEQMVYMKDTFKMLAKNEMAHAKLFYNYIIDNMKDKDKVDICADYPYVEADLETSLKKETEIEKLEFEKIYPESAKIAKKEGFDDIAQSFTLVGEVEKTHSAILNDLYKKYKNKSLYKGKRLYKCSNCGHIENKTDGWKKCPLCSMVEGYIQIDFNDILLDCVK